MINKLTKQVLMDQTKILLKEKAIVDISIGEITAKSLLKRQSFYYHFQDIYDIIFWIVNLELFIPYATIFDQSGIRKALEFLYEEYKTKKDIYGKIFFENKNNSSTDELLSSFMLINKEHFKLKEEILYAISHSIIYYIKFLIDNKIDFNSSITSFIEILQKTIQ